MSEYIRLGYLGQDTSGQDRIFHVRLVQPDWLGKLNLFRLGLTLFGQDVSGQVLVLVMSGCIRLGNLWLGQDVSGQASKISLAMFSSLCESSLKYGEFKKVEFLTVLSLCPSSQKYSPVNIPEGKILSLLQDVQGCTCYLCPA